MALKARVPWYAKMAAKMVLARVPTGYGFWRHLSLFRHGAMEQPDYAYRVFRAHYERASPIGQGNGLVVLELGPGDSVATALIAPAFGAAHTLLVDVGCFADTEMQVYRDVAAHLARQGLPTPDLSHSSSVEQLLAACNAEYLTNGLDSLRGIPDGSVDFVFSHSVLEHIRRAEFADTLRQLRRIVRSTGVASHNVDLRDHLGGALNHLRFSRRSWESDAMASSGFYTNRIRYGEMMDLFREAGFDATPAALHRWDRLPTPRERMWPPFQSLPNDDLRVSGFDVVLRPI